LDPRWGSIVIGRDDFPGFTAEPREPWAVVWNAVGVRGGQPGLRLVPRVAFVEVDAVFLAEAAELILERFLAVVVRLVRDVFDEFVGWVRRGAGTPRIRERLNWE
jgi:hypothetical protein